MAIITIRPIAASPDMLSMLAALLIETVASGGSVSFMHPLSPEKAHAFWESSLAAAARGERVVFGAFDADTLVGTITLVTALPENQPHRAEIAKMMVAVRYRGQGIATRLIQTAEAAAVAAGRTQVLLDTATDGGAAGLYERAGYVCVGEMPEYAVKPHGGLTATRLYWKRIG